MPSAHRESRIPCDDSDFVGDSPNKSCQLGRGRPECGVFFVARQFLGKLGKFHPFRVAWDFYENYVFFRGVFFWGVVLVGGQTPLKSSKIPNMMGIGSCISGFKDGVISGWVEHVMFSSSLLRRKKNRFGLFADA